MIVTLLVLLCVYWFCFRGVALKISPETTKITEPRTADGKRIDYFQAIVEISEPQVPPRENGFRMIAEALGRIPFENIGMDYWKKICQKLDLDPSAPPTTAYDKRMRPLYEAANAELGITTPLDDEERIKTRPEGTPEDSPRLWNIDPPAQDWVEAKLKQAMENLWTGDMEPVMEQYIQDISPVLDLLGEAVRKDVYYIPLVEYDNDGSLCILLPCIQSQREFARDLSRRIMYSLGKGEIDKAIDDIITIFRLGQHLQKESILVVRLVGQAIQFIGFSAAVHILQDTKLTREQIERLRTSLDDLPEKLPVSDIYLSEEYEMYDTISALSRKKYAFNLFSGESFPGGAIMKPKLDWLNYYGYDWNIVAKAAGKIFQQQIDIRSEPDPTKRMTMRDELWATVTQIDQRRQKLLSYWRMIFVSTRSKMMGDAIGRRFISHEFEHSLNPGDAAIELLRLACALELYKADEGRYPDKLEKLEGKYLQKIPGDPCTETLEPFRYRLEERDADESGNVRYGYLLYGLGRGGKDHNGKTCIKIPGAEDLHVPDSKEMYNIPIRK